jgi:hypothetical protein
MKNEAEEEMIEIYLHFASISCLATPSTWANSKG